MLYLLAPAKKRKSPSDGGGGSAGEPKLQTVGLVKVKTNTFVMQWSTQFLPYVYAYLNCVQRRVDLYNASCCQLRVQTTHARDH